MPAECKFLIVFSSKGTSFTPSGSGAANGFSIVFCVSFGSDAPWAGLCPAAVGGAIARGACI